MLKLELSCSNLDPQVARFFFLPPFVLFLSKAVFQVIIY